MKQGDCVYINYSNFKNYYIKSFENRKSLIDWFNRHNVYYIVMDFNGFKYQYILLKSVIDGTMLSLHHSVLSPVGPFIELKYHVIL